MKKISLIIPNVVVPTEFDYQAQQAVNGWLEEQCIKYNIDKSNLLGKREPHRFSVLYQQVCNMAGGVRFEVPENIKRAYENATGTDFHTDLWTYLEDKVNSDFNIDAECYDYEDSDYEYDLA